MRFRFSLLWLSISDETQVSSPEELPLSSLQPEKQEKARLYARLNRRLMLIELLIAALYTLAWLLMGWSQAAKQVWLSLTSQEWVLVAGFAALFGGIYYLLTLPLSFYAGFVLPHRFELSTQTIRGWITDQVKGLLVGGVLGLALLEVIYFILHASPDNWWLWVGGVLLLFDVLLAQLGPVILLPIFYKFTLLGAEYADLEQRLMSLAERANTRVRGVYQFDMSRRTRAANAALTGLGNTRRIVLGDTLLKQFTPEEIETVMAHELAHHVHADIPLGILIESVVTLAGLYLASLALKWGISFFGFASPADVAAMPLLALITGAYGLLTMPLLNAYSRWRESRADQFALQITGNGPAYVSALIRLANQNLAEVDPPPWVEFFLYSHPALSKRIAMARRWPHRRDVPQVPPA